MYKAQKRYLTYLKFCPKSSSRQTSLLGKELHGQFVAGGNQLGDVVIGAISHQGILCLLQQISN